MTHPSYAKLAETFRKASANVELNPSIPAATRLPHAEAAMRSVVATAIGTGSVCWESPAGAGVFDSELATAVVESAMAALLDVVKLGEPHLGCATTAELRTELAARESDPTSAADDYRTVDA